MEEQLVSFLYLINRFLHILATALLLGGTLFFELVVPIAIEDLKEEQKLLVFARARWVFRWVVWCVAIMLLLSGLVSTYRNWHVYTSAAPDGASVMSFNRVGIWWLMHAGGAALGLCIALALVRGPTPPRRPLFWMRVNLLILLLVVLLASTTRHVRLRLLEHIPESPSKTID